MIQCIRLDLLTAHRLKHSLTYRYCAFKHYFQKIALGVMSSILRKSKVLFLFSLNLNLESEVLGQNADLSTSVSDSQYSVCSVWMRSPHTE